MKKKPADIARDIVSLMEDTGDFTMEDFEFIQAHSTGELLAKIEDHLMNMDEKAEEQRQMDEMDGIDAARDWEMECRGDQMREDNAAFRRGE
jgi:hypothetical protein